MLNMKWTLSAAMLAGAFAGSVSQVYAQSENYRGSFTLPFEARVGNVILQPGTYTVKTLEGAHGVRITGDSGKASILAAGYEFNKGTEKPKLIFTDSNGMYSLESFDSGAAGQTLHFYQTKSRRGVERAASTPVKPNVEVGLQ
jgi:hypothetical protein